ncbi:MAG: GIY-YIG nuclease family protein [Rhodocyclaceae bacterium]
MEIRYEHETGWPSQLGLHKRISAYARTDRASAFKVGITNSPETRASQYRSNGSKYHEMIVLYQTTSDKHVREVERIFCDYYAGYADNLIGGGGGPKGEGPYFLYVVVARLL